MTFSKGDDYRPSDEHYGPLWERYGLSIYHIGYSAICALNDAPYGKIMSRIMRDPDGYRVRTKKKYAEIIETHNMFCDYLVAHPEEEKIYLAKNNYNEVLTKARLWKHMNEKAG